MNDVVRVVIISIIYWGTVAIAKVLHWKKEHKDD